MTSNSIKLIDNSLSHEDILYFRKKIVAKYRNIFSNDKWDIIVKIDRKGILLYDDITRGELLNVKCVANYNSFLNNETLFKNKKILLFDDSIHKGKTILKNINIISEHNPHSLDIAVVLADKNVFSNLKRKFHKSKINFMNPYMFGNNEEHFLLLYKKYISPYLDYICLPQTKDLIIDKITFKGYLDDETLINLFSDKESSIRIYKSFDDRSKMEMKLKCNAKNLIEEADKKSIDAFFEYDQLRVRFFVHKVNLQTTVYIEYIAFPNYFQKPTKPCKSCRVTKIKELKNNGEDCLACLIYNTTKNLRKTILKKMNEENIEKEMWIFKGEIIDREYEY
ncbi:phosphoribosyltransferase [uncultured Methanolobus sp.]|uniref:phosphoribosyltransferase n=1 Tax=uncultured Methanolobus sp. TaxID=218300 RepID=UPI002AAB619C|nr:phosphoribosyltransferase [uncultured Methanolobus sp.]